MQVSYGKLTANDGKEMGERRRWWRCLAPDARRHTIGRCHVALPTQSETVYFGGWKKFFILW